MAGFLRVIKKIFFDFPAIGWSAGFAGSKPQLQKHAIVPTRFWEGAGVEVPTGPEFFAVVFSRVKLCARGCSLWSEAKVIAQQSHLAGGDQ